jgi:hypothetical protein
LIPVLAIFLCCSNRGIIDSDKIPHILADMLIADRSLMQDFKNIQKVDTTMLYEPVLNRYGYTTRDFIRTMDFYLPRPAKLKSFYMKAKDILDSRNSEIDKKIADIENTKIIFSKVYLALEQKDSLRLTDSYIRALRWIIAPDSFPCRRIYLPDSLADRYEYPGMAIWWKNNMKSENIIFYKHEKDRSSLSLSTRQAPDPERLSLPEH